MNVHEVTEELSLRDIVNSFIGSYTEQNKSMEFSRWLSYKLSQEIPELSQEAGEKLANEIIEAVAAYDKTLYELKQAIEKGQSKEEWFAECLAGNYADMAPADVGEKLLKIEEDFSASNSMLMQGINEQETKIELADEEEGDEEHPVQWNEYSVRSKAYEIGRQLALTGTAVAANIMKEKVQNEDNADIGSVVKETLQDGLIKDSGEAKALVAGAVKVAAEKGIKNIIPEDMPENVTTEMIGSISGAAVESTLAMAELANSESTMTDTLDKIGMSVVAAGGRMASSALKDSLARVPYVGPLLVDVAGGLLGHLQSHKFAQNIYGAIRDAAIDTWEGLKESKIVAMARRAKNIIFG